MSFAEAFFLGSKALALLLLPPTGFLLIAAIALVFRRRWPRAAATALWASIACLFVLSLPVVEGALLRSLHVESQVQTSPSVQAIVVWGGGLRRATAEYGDTLALQSLDRARYGAALHRRFDLPILVTGGQVYGGRPEAELMAETLRDEFKVPVRWVEGRARHTGENAQFAARLLRAENIERVLLVTHDYHMKRSLQHCARAGLHCVPAPVSLRGATRDSWVQLLPNAGALSTSSLVFHEYLGLLAIELR